MNDHLLLQNLPLFKSLIGTQIISVSRYILKSDSHIDEFQQNGDGPVEIQFDNGTVIHFRAYTQGNSVTIFTGKMPLYGDSYMYMDVTHNSFWSSRIWQKITDVYIFQSEHFVPDFPLECVLEMFFANNTNACIEYIDNEEFFDALRVTSQFDKSNLIRHKV